MSPEARAAVYRASHTLTATAPDGHEWTVVGPYAEHAVQGRVTMAGVFDPLAPLQSCRIAPGETCEHGYSCRRVWP